MTQITGKRVRRGGKAQWSEHDAELMKAEAQQSDKSEVIALANMLSVIKQATT